MSLFEVSYSGILEQDSIQTKTICEDVMCV